MTPNQDMYWTLLLIRCMALQKCKPRTIKIKKTWIQRPSVLRLLLNIYVSSCYIIS